MNDIICKHTLYDRETAIKNLGGMVWLYEKQLCKFKTTYADSAIMAKEYLLHGNTGEARILIHSIKGLAGTLGMRQLYYAAADLEQAIIKSDPSLDNLMQQYEKYLEATLSHSDKA